MAKIISGGGITGNKVKQVGVKAGPPRTNKISPRGVSQLGYSTGSMMSGPGSFTSKNSSLPMKTGTTPQVPMGNTVALNVKGGGPGTGRQVFRTGSQGVHGPVVAGSFPPGQPRDILSAFGPEPTDKSPLVERRR